jgi:cyclic pyranopterin phosphate synthase
VLGVHREGREEAAPDRRRAAGAQEHHELIEKPVAAPETGALEELTLTTNGSQLTAMPRACMHGVRRINVSLDTLDPDKFKAITRWGDLTKVWTASPAAQEAGLKIKINAVALKGFNEHEIPDDRLGAWRGHGPDPDRDHAAGRYRWRPHRPVSAAVEVRRPRSAVHADRHSLQDRRAGALCRVEETGGKLGFITPMTHNFCESCNRVRLTCTGTLYMCLGQDDAADLRAPLRASEGNELLQRRHRRGHRPQAEGP